ncbi:MAG: Dabb family protein [Novosphingobium sp.]
MITHIVFFWLKNPQSEEDRDKLLEGVRGLGAIPQVRSVQAGVPAKTEARDAVDHSFGVSEVLTFDSLEDQLAYQQHPLHLRFIAEYGHLWDGHKVYDIVEPG